MLDKLKAEFDVIIELVKRAPAPLQETAFKMILEHWFSANAVSKQSAAPPILNVPTTPPPSGAVPDSVKPFLTANGITTEIFEKVYHPTGPGAQLLVATIPGNSKASQLINLSLLLAIKQALEFGSFSCTLKELRELAIHYDCYDSPNFSKNLKTNKNYYKPRDKGIDLELSGPGLRKAGDLIKTIAASA